VFDAVTSIRKALNGRVPLIGFSGSPWTLACYMVEGGGSDDYRLVKSMLYSRPDLMHRMLAVNAEAVAAYLNAQIDAGAQAVMVFDSWGGVLADGAFQAFSLAYTARVLAQLKRSHDGQTSRASSSPRAAGCGWTPCATSAATCWASTGPSTSARRVRLVGDVKALQGNLDPNVLFAEPEQIRAEVGKALAAFGAPGDGHVFNLGHGISQFTPPESVSAMVSAVHEISRTMRAQR
jgi:uroporphyrinogen decarboxylase